MKTLVRLAGLVALWAVFAPAHAQSKESLDLASRLFERTGLAVQLQSFSAQFGEGLEENRGKIPDEMIAALAEAGKKSYAVSALRAEIVPSLARKMPAADMKQALAWLDGRIGRRVTLAEERASGHMTQEEMQAYLERDKAKPAGPKRVKLLAELGTATNAAEIGASFIEAMSLGIAVGMDATLPEEKRIGVAGLRARLREIMPPEKLRENMSASLPAMFGFTYRQVSDADLAAYVKFNGSPLGQRYNHAITESLAEALTHASMRIGALLQPAPEKKQI
jgi:hypothetical protein